MMEKRGVIDTNTPQPDSVGRKQDAKPTEPVTKQAADGLDGGFMSQLSDAAADAANKAKK